MKKTFTILTFILITAVMLILPITAPAPPGNSWVPSFASQAGGSISQLVEGGSLEFDRGYIMEIDDPVDFSKIVSMDRNFSKGQKVMVKFTDKGMAKILMPDKKKVVILHITDGKWVLNKITDQSAW